MTPHDDAEILKNSADHAIAAGLTYVLVPIDACLAGAAALLRQGRGEEEQKNDLGGDDAHGGREDLGPAAPAPASHVGSCGWLPIETMEWPEWLSAGREAIYVTDRGRVLAAFAHSNGWVYGNLKLSTKESGYCASYPARHDASLGDHGPLPKDTERVTHWMPLPDSPRAGSASVVAEAVEIAYQLGRVKSVEHTPRELAALNAAIAHYERVGCASVPVSEASTPTPERSAEDTPSHPDPSL